MNDFGVTQKKFKDLLNRMALCGINENDLLEKFIKGTGPGGQKVNKSSTCVYLKHEPTQIEVKMGQERTQSLNRYYARKRMCELIEELKFGKNSPSLQKEDKIRRQKERRKRRRRRKNGIE